MVGKEPTIQIHYTGNNHWVCSNYDNNNGRLFLYDSLYIKTTTMELDVQLAQLYGTESMQLGRNSPSTSTSEMILWLCAFCIGNSYMRCRRNTNLGSKRNETPLQTMHSKRTDISISSNYTWGTYRKASTISSIFNRPSMWLYSPRIRVYLRRKYNYACCTMWEL